MAGGIGLIDLVLHIIAGGGGAQLQGGRIFLGVLLQPFNLFGGFPRTEDERTRRQRVEGAGMT